MRLIERNPNYSIDEFGNVYSKPRAGTKGGLVKPMTSKTGYYTVMLGSDRRPVKVHRLVAQTYVPNPEGKPFVNHIDGNKLNNHVSNLEWCTSKENILHAHLNGLMSPLRGESHQDAKLTDGDVKWIRANYIGYDREFGTRAMARKFGVNKTAIIDILAGRTWKHLL